MGLLRITVDDSVRVSAHQARLHASVKGSATVLGNAAARKAAEVRKLVAALDAAGVGEDAVEVEGIRLDSRSGMLGKGQSVEYLLTVVATPDSLPAVLGVLADQPNLTLDHLEWVFDSFEASIGATAAAMAKARRKAAAVAAAADTEVRGITNASDSWNMPAARVEFGGQDAVLLGARAAKGAPVDLGIEINATQELFVHLTVDFELAP